MLYHRPKANLYFVQDIAAWEYILERHTLSKYPASRMILVWPSMAFLIMSGRNIELVRSTVPGFSNATHMFIPINNTADALQAENGSHWSLLIVSTLDKSAFHYDSLEDTNNYLARHATKQLSKLLGKSWKYADLKSPQQKDPNDSGVFVCMFMRHLLGRLLSPNKKIDMEMAGKRVDYRAGRKDIFETIR